MNVKPCQGCWHYWLEEFGVCIHDDDFLDFYDLFVKADYFLVAAPLYIFHLPATVKTMIDRMFLNLKPD